MKLRLRLSPIRTLHVLRLGIYSHYMPANEFLPFVNTWSFDLCIDLLLFDVRITLEGAENKRPA